MVEIRLFGSTCLTLLFSAGGPPNPHPLDWDSAQMLEKLLSSNSVEIFPVQLPTKDGTSLNGKPDPTKTGGGTWRWKNPQWRVV